MKFILKDRIKEILITVIKRSGLGTYFKKKGVNHANLSTGI